MCYEVIGADWPIWSCEYRIEFAYKIKRYIRTILDAAIHQFGELSELTSTS